MHNQRQHKYLPFEFSENDIFQEVFQGKAEQNVLFS